MQSSILKIYEYLGENIKIADKKWDRNMDLADKFEKQIREAIKGDEKLTELYDKLSRAIEESHVIELEETYKAGFKDGAKIIIEVCD